MLSSSAFCSDTLSCHCNLDVYENFYCFNKKQNSVEVKDTFFSNSTFEESFNCSDLNLLNSDIEFSVKFLFWDQK